MKKKLMLLLACYFILEINANAQLIPVQKNGWVGYINTEGDIVIPFIYREARYFNKGLAVARVRGQYGYINNKGEIVVPMIYDRAYDIVDDYLKVRKNGEWILLDTSGRESFRSSVDNVSYHHDYINLSKDLKNGNTRSWTMLVSNDSVLKNITIGQRFSNGYYSYYNNKFEHGIIDDKGKIIIPAEPTALGGDCIDENQGYFLIGPRKKYDVSQIVYLYTPNGKKIKILPDRSTVFFDFSYDKNLDYPYLFKVVETSLDELYEIEPSKKRQVKEYEGPLRVFLIDTAGKLTVTSPQATIPKSMNTDYDSAQNVDFEIHFDEMSERYYISYSDGKVRFLPEGFHYEKFNGLIKRKLNGSTLYGIMDTSLNVVLANKACCMNRIHKGVSVTHAWNRDSSWYFNSRGKLIWEIGTKEKDIDKGDTLFRAKTSLSLSLDSVYKSATVPLSKHMITMNVSDTSIYTTACFRAKSSVSKYVYINKPIIQIKDKKNKWHTVKEGPYRMRCLNYSNKIQVLKLGAGNQFCIDFKNFYGIYQTKMRLGFEVRNQDRLSDNKLHNRMYMFFYRLGRRYVFSNEFPVSINPDQLYFEVEIQ